MPDSYGIIYIVVSCVGLFVFMGIMDSLKPPVKKFVDLASNVFVVSYIGYLVYKLFGGLFLHLRCEIVRDGVCLVP